MQGPAAIVNAGKEKWSEAPKEEGTTPEWYFTLAAMWMELNLKIPRIRQSRETTSLGKDPTGPPHDRRPDRL